ncbi:RDD family protein [Paenibacillus psychroresistens]|uniref:RDD family protein n=1 Tax=Paenibacillus psychroresistens TaxID=1778678 RepID=A0A6B8RTQ3_9BACL|nr:RDD family protein [Paenibacillus psychroresistens]QGQ99152.1 RDD family protein [Paenibacillus psychroresistens]
MKIYKLKMVVRFAGFGQRLVSLVIDGFLLSLCYFIINFLITRRFNYYTAENSDSLVLIQLVAAYLYFTIFESSEYQATPGKLALGIKVVNHNIKRISFARSNARFISKFLSYITLFIGFLIAAFNKIHKAIHDIISKTYVINTNPVKNKIRIIKESGNLRGQSIKLKK